MSNNQRKAKFYIGLAEHDQTKARTIFICYHPSEDTGEIVTSVRLMRQKVVEHGKYD